LIGGAASGINPPPVFWRTRQVQQFLTSREVNDHYRAVRMELSRTEEQPPEAPEFSVELRNTNSPEENGQWYLDSRSNSVQESSRTDSEVYKSSDSNNSDSGTLENTVYISNFDF